MQQTLFLWWRTNADKSSSKSAKHCCSCHLLCSSLLTYHTCPEAPPLAFSSISYSVQDRPSCFQGLHRHCSALLNWTAPKKDCESLCAPHQQPATFRGSPLTRCKTFGDRAFAHAAPKIWNNLPLAVWESWTIECFKTRLKTFLFKSAFECFSYKTFIDGNFNYLDTFKVGCLLTLYPILNFNLFQFIIIIFFINVKRFRILCNASAI